MNPAFPHMVPAAAPETRNGRPTRLIAGNRRQMHGHLAGGGNKNKPPPPGEPTTPSDQQAHRSEPVGEQAASSVERKTRTSVNLPGPGISADPRRASVPGGPQPAQSAPSVSKPSSDVPQHQSVSRSSQGGSFPGQQTSKHSYAGTPPGMPWMAAHHPGGVVPPPPPPREDDPAAYIDPIPARKVDGDGNSFHYVKPMHRSGASPWKPPPPPSEEQRSRMRTRSEAAPSDRRTEHQSHYDSAEKFMQQQRDLQDELLKMKNGSEAKREAISAKLAEARSRQQEAAAERAKIHAEDAAKRKAAQAARMSQVDAAFRKAQDAARRMEEEQRQQQGQRPKEKPFAGDPDPKAAQEEDFRRRQAAADARRRREAAANGAPGAKSYQYCQHQSANSARPPQASTAPSKPSVSEAAQFRKHEAAWTLFEKQTPRCITMATVPWPPAGKDILKGAVSAALGQSKSTNEDAEIRSQYRRLAMRWHPDKFLSKYGPALAEIERERILERVKGVQQAVNQSYSLLKPA